MRSIRRQAAAWVIRLERGLTPEEQDEFSCWLASDPQHGKALREYDQGWSRLDRLGQWLPEHSTQPNPDLIALPLHRCLARPIFIALSAAALLILLFSLNRGGWFDPPSTVSEQVSVDDFRQVLSDGTVVKLNTGARIQEHYTSQERRVVLNKGEAHFTVVHEPVRPFIVSVRGIDVRAVGTAFNVRIDDAAVEVLVTEGRVQIQAAIGSAPVSAESAAIRDIEAAIPILEARQRAVVSFSSAVLKPEIATLTSGEIERVLAWQHRRLDFKAATLANIVAEFNRRNTTQIVLRDPELAAMRLTVSFRSDNIDGFVHLIETGFGVHCERQEREIILTRLPE